MEWDFEVVFSSDSDPNIQNSFEDYVGMINWVATVDHLEPFIAGTN